MRLSEFIYNDVKTSLGKNNMRLSDLGAISFGKGPTNKNNERTPHYEITKGMEMFELNPIVNSAIYQLLSFVIPNKTIKISSKDAKTVEWLEKWHQQRKGSLEEIKNIWLTKTMCGNAYLERYYMGTENNALDNFFSINDASRIYVNPNDVGGDSAFIFELPISIKKFMYRGIWQTPDFYSVTYIKNYQYVFKKVWGFPIPGWKISHYKSGWSRDNLYGRSPLLSGIDAHNVLQELISSWDTISKTRQIDQKLITVADSETGINLDPEKMDELEEVLNDADKSYTLFNVPLKIIQQDINTSGNYDLMEGVFDVLRRMLISSLLPNHLTPWSDSGTTQGAEAAMPPLLARIKASQNELNNFLTKHIIDELRKTETWLAEDAMYLFEEPKIIDDSYYIRKVTDLVSAEIMTPEAAKKYLLNLGIIDKEIFEQEDKDKDEEKDDQKELKEQLNKEDISCSFKEASTNSDMSFNTFKLKLKTQNKALKTNGWRQLKFKNVGGHNIRMIQADKQILIFDGLVIMETLDTEIVTEEVYNKTYANYIKKVEDSFEKFDNGESDEDKIVAELEKEVKAELEGQLQKVLNLVGKSGVKKEALTEAFLNFKILPKIDGLFKNFNLNINKAITKAMNKLGVTIIDPDTRASIGKQGTDMLQRKRKLMVDNIKTNIKGTKDDMIRSIKTKLSQGITAGQSIDDIKKDIRKSFDYDKDVAWKFKRVIKTSLNTSSKILKLQKFKRMGFETVQWITRHDSKVRDAHSKMNNRVYKIDYLLKLIASGKFPGTLFNCRCSLISYS